MNYKILDLVQGSEQWLKARYNYVTASDASVLFNISPYKTKLQLFEEKVTHSEDPKNAGKETLFQIGHNAEIKGREWLKRDLGHDLPPAVVVSNQVPELLASLDGFSEKEKVIAEFKYVGREVLKNVKNGILPAHHECQVQAQLLATGFERCFYFAMDPDGSAANIEIFPDPKYQEQIATEVKSFMQMVRDGEAPEPGEKDFVHLKDPRFDWLCKLKIDIEVAEAEYEKIRKQLIAEYKDIPRIKAGGLQMIRIFKKGNVNYSAIPNLNGVDLEKFRKASTTQYQIRFDGEHVKEKKSVS